METGKFAVFRASWPFWILRCTARSTGKFWECHRANGNCDRVLSAVGRICLDFRCASQCPDFLSCLCIAIKTFNNWRTLSSLHKFLHKKFVQTGITSDKTTQETSEDLWVSSFYDCFCASLVQIWCHVESLTLWVIWNTVSEITY